MNLSNKLSNSLIIILLILSLSGISAGANNVTMSVIPKNAEAGAGEIFIVSVDVNPNDNSLYGAQFELSFDPTILEAIKIDKGQLLGQDGAQTINPIQKPINNSIGKVEYAESRIGTQTGVKTPGKLAIITFKVKDDAKLGSNQSFSLLNIILTDSDVKPLFADINNGDLKVVQGGKSPAVTAQETPAKKDVISPELQAEMNKKKDTDKIFIKISVDQKDSVQNLMNLASFLESKGTEVSDVNATSEAITGKVSKKLITETGNLPYVTEITLLTDTSGAKKQPGFGIIITITGVMVMYLFNKIRKS
jgi:hypothetical protein